MFPRNWNLRTVEDLCLRITSGGTPKRSNPNYYEPGTIPWIKTADLNDAYIHQYSEYISEAGLRESSAKLLPANTVLMAMYGATVGMLGMLTEEATCNQASCALIADPAVCDHRWLFYALLNDRDFIISQATGAAQQNLSGKTIRQFQYPTPPLKEQQAIAEVLGALDDKIAANTKLAAICDNLALSTLHACPVSVPVGEIVTYKKGSIDVSTLGAPAVAHFSLPAFDSGKLPDLCNPNEIKSNKAHVQAPSVLISKLNPRFPRVWNLPELPGEPAVASTEFLVLEPKFSSTSVLWAILSQEKFKRELETQVAGTSGSHQRVKPADLLATKAIDPRDLNSETQHLITALCQTSFHSQYENRHLEATRDALLPQLMSGKLRVKDTEKVVEDSL